MLQLYIIIIKSTKELTAFIMMVKAGKFTFELFELLFFQETRRCWQTNETPTSQQVHSEKKNRLILEKEVEPKFQTRDMFQRQILKTRRYGVYERVFPQ